MATKARSTKIRSTKIRRTIYQIDEAGNVDLFFHSGQQRAWDSKARIVAMISGSQGGKTAAGPWWLAREIFGDEESGVVGGGAGDYLAVTASYDLFKLKMLPELLTVFEEILGVGRLWAGDKIIEIKDPETGKFWAAKSTDPMWARIILRSAQSGGGLESATAKAAWCDEAGQDSFSLDDWEAILRRLSLFRGRVLISTTIYNAGWLKQQVYERWKAGDTTYDVVQFASILNPLFPRDEFERARGSMADHKFKMFYLGQFAKPPGLIYSDYDEERHLVNPFQIPADWPRYVGIDFGGPNLATLWAAYSAAMDKFVVYRETMDGALSTKEHVELALNRALQDGGFVMGWQGGSGSEGQCRRDWATEGIIIPDPEITDVGVQISKVIELFRTDRVLIFKTLAGLRDQLGTYSNKLDKDGEVTDQIQEKRKFHYLDAFRYMVTPLVAGQMASALPSQQFTGAARGGNGNGKKQRIALGV